MSKTKCERIVKIVFVMKAGNFVMKVFSVPVCSRSLICHTYYPEGPLLIKPRISHRAVHTGPRLRLRLRLQTETETETIKPSPSL